MLYRFSPDYISNFRSLEILKQNFRIQSIQFLLLLNRMIKIFHRLFLTLSSPFTEDGGNSIEDDWPGEPADQYWRQQLDQAEGELRQVSDLSQINFYMEIFYSAKSYFNCVITIFFVYRFFKEKCVVSTTVVGVFSYYFE